MQIKFEMRLPAREATDCRDLETELQNSAPNLLEHQLFANTWGLLSPDSRPLLLTLGEALTPSSGMRPPPASSELLREGHIRAFRDRHVRRTLKGLCHQFRIILK